MLSSTELMKQAEHWGVFSTPTLNHTGAVEGGQLIQQHVGELGVEGVGDLDGGEVAVGQMPQPVMVSTTRPMSCLTECSRSGVP
jgi:hypothetical protein